MHQNRKDRDGLLVGGHAESAAEALHIWRDRWAAAHIPFACDPKASQWSSSAINLADVTGQSQGYPIVFSAEGTGVCAGIRTYDGASPRGGDKA
jgi:hypothetical protein